MKPTKRGVDDDQMDDSDAEMKLEEAIESLQSLSDDAQNPEGEEEEADDDFGLARKRRRRHSRRNLGGAARGPKGKFPWTQETENDLIEWWKENEVLYNVNYPDYYNRANKERLFEAKAKEIGDGCRAADVEIHLRSMRTKLSRILQQGPDRSNGTPRTVREIWIFKRLDFLMPFVCVKKTPQRKPKPGKKENIASEEEVTNALLSMCEDYVGMDNDSEARPEPSPSTPSPPVGDPPGPSRHTRSSTARQTRTSMKSRSQNNSQDQDQDQDQYVPRQQVNTGVAELQMDILTKLASELERARSSAAQPTPSRSLVHASALPTEQELDQQELTSFLGHLRSTMQRLPAHSRLEAQEEMLGVTYAKKHELLRAGYQSGYPTSFPSKEQPYSVGSSGEQVGEHCASKRRKLRPEDSNAANHASSSASHSASDQIYLDYNATTPVEPAVIETITAALTDAWGNPSSANPQGQLAKRIINTARGQVATMVGASPSDIIFTSGGTEANNLVIHTAIEHFRRTFQSSSSGSHSKPHIITSNIEHDSIKLPLQQLMERDIAGVTFVEVSQQTGRVEPEQVLAAILPTTCLITIMHGNNETGVIQPVENIFQEVRAMPCRALPLDAKQCLPTILLHTDAAQTVGKIEVDVKGLNADYLTIVGHKFYGPRIGALYVRGGAGEGSNVPLHPMLYGGGQERNLRPGTENTGMIAGLGKAAELVTQNLHRYESHMRMVRDYLERSMENAFPVAVCFNGRFPGSTRLPNTCNVSFLGKNLQGRKILSKAKGLQASVGAACHSHCGDRPSHILLAIGVPHEVATNALRLSVGRGTTTDDIDSVISDLQQAIASLQAERDS